MKKTKEPRKNKFLLTFICIFLAVVLIFGITMGVVIAVTNARVGAKYGSINMSEGALRAFISDYKSEYVARLLANQVHVFDHESFWSSMADGEHTYGEYLGSATEEKVREYVVKAALFDSVRSLTVADKKRIDGACREVLFDRVGSYDEGAFNKLTEPYGFTYADMKEMATVVYKAERALSVFYGEGGEKVIYREDGKCEEYLATYSHVYILFIRTEDTFVKDENGNRVEEGALDVLRPLTDAERAERAEVIGNIRAAIEAKKNGGDMVITPTMFFEYVDKYSDNDPSADKDGYYLKSGTAYTELSRIDAPELTEAALEMAVGEFLEVPFDDAGVCFLYRSEPKPGAYLFSSDGDSLSDFSAGAAAYCFESDVQAFMSNVVLTEKYYMIDPTKIKYTNEFFPIVE